MEIGCSVKALNSPLYFLACLQLFSDVIQSEHELIGFLARGVRRKAEDPVADVIVDFWGRKPAAAIKLLIRRLRPLAEDCQVAAGVGGGVLLEYHRAFLVEIHLQEKSANDIDDSCTFDVLFCHERSFENGELNRIIPTDRNFLSAAHRFRIGFYMHAESTQCFFTLAFLGGLAATR